MATTPQEDGAKADIVNYERKAGDIPVSSNGLDAPLIYAEDIRGAMVGEANVKFNIVDYRVNVQTDELMAVHTATLVIPKDKIAGWGRYFLKLGGDELPAETPEKPDANA